MEFAFSLFMNNFEKAAAIEKELLAAIETMEPITKLSKMNAEAYNELLRKEIARYMDEHRETESYNPDETIRHEIGER